MRYLAFTILIIAALLIFFVINFFLNSLLYSFILSLVVVIVLYRIIDIFFLKRKNKHLPLIKPAAAELKKTRRCFNKCLRRGLLAATIVLWVSAIISLPELIPPISRGLEEIFSIRFRDHTYHLVTLSLISSYAYFTVMLHESQRDELRRKNKPIGWVDLVHKDDEGNDKEEDNDDNLKTTTRFTNNSDFPIEVWAHFYIKKRWKSDGGKSVEKKYVEEKDAREINEELGFDTLGKPYYEEAPVHPPPKGKFWGGFNMDPLLEDYNDDLYLKIEARFKKYKDENSLPLEPHEKSKMPTQYWRYRAQKGDWSLINKEDYETAFE